MSRIRSTERSSSDSAARSDRRHRGANLFLSLLLPAAIALLCVGVLIDRWPGSPSPPPNVILVLVDTLRADFTSVYRYPRPTTPNLADFAAESIVFENAMSQATCTFPSVNSLFTSRYPGDFLDQPRGSLGIPAGIPTLAEILAENGFATHAVSASPIVRDRPLRGPEDAAPFDEASAFGAGFHSFEEKEWSPAKWVSERARAILRNVAPPFFLYLHFIDPHDSYSPPASFGRRFSHPMGDEKWFVTNGDPRPIEKMLYGGGPQLQVSESDIRGLKDRYADEIAYFDWHFGQLVAYLERLGRLDDSIIIVASDHGESFLEHGHIKHCRSVYNNLTWTPLIVRLPGGRPHGRRTALAQNLDLVPTILDYLEVSVRDASFEGKSLRPVIEADTEIHDAIYSAQYTARAIRRKNLKLVHDLESGSSQLFDVERDPGETRDLSRLEPEWVVGLEEILLHRQAESGPSTESSVDSARRMREALRAIGYLE